jgi:malate permease and related proteins
MTILFLKMLPLVLMSLAGYVFCRMKWIDAAFNRQLSLLMLNLFYPCLIISSILRNFTLDDLRKHWMMPVGTIFILTTGWLVGWATLPFVKRQTLSTQRCYHFICMMNNYSFLPILLAASLWNEKAVALIAFSALGSELCVWTLGMKAMTGQPLERKFLRNLVSMPMLALGIAFLLLVVCNLCVRHHWVPVAGSNTDELFATLLDTFSKMGSATVPASALICGARIAMLHPHNLVSPLILGTTFLRLLVIPAITIGGLLLVPMDHEMRRVLILIATMPVAMASVTLAEAFQSDADFSAAAILVTHIACLVTVPLWLLATKI